VVPEAMDDLRERPKSRLDLEPDGIQLNNARRKDRQIGADQYLFNAAFVPHQHKPQHLVQAVPPKHVKAEVFHFLPAAVQAKLRFRKLVRPGAEEVPQVDFLALFPGPALGVAAGLLISGRAVFGRRYQCYIGSPVFQRLPGDCL